MTTCKEKVSLAVAAATQNIKDGIVAGPQTFRRAVRVQSEQSPLQILKSAPQWNGQRVHPHVGENLRDVRQLSKQVTALSRPNDSIAISIDKGIHGNYVARHLDGNEWAQGRTPMEAFGELVFSHANARMVTVERVEFGY